MAMSLWRGPCYSGQDDVLPGLKRRRSPGERGIPALAAVSPPTSFPLFNIFVGEVHGLILLASCCTTDLEMYIKNRLRDETRGQAEDFRARSTLSGRSCSAARLHVSAGLGCSGKY